MQALVKRAKEVLASEFGTLTGTDKSPLAEDFQFVSWMFSFHADF